MANSKISAQLILIQRQQVHYINTS